MAGGLRLTCSVGLAVYPTDGETREALVGAADQAMYAAKTLGRNQARASSDPAVRAVLGQAGGATSREENALMGIVEALVGVVEARDRSTGAHTHEVALLVTRLAAALDVPAPEARMMALAGRLRDVGKVGVPDAILQKHGPLSPPEWEVMRTHATVAADIVGRVPGLLPLTPLVRGHHEHWDGQGYPDGLSGAAIPLGARIIAVADAYRTMTIDRPYRDAHTPPFALDELRRGAGAQFDPRVVAALERILAADQAAEAS